MNDLPTMETMTMHGTVTRYVQVRDRQWRCVLDVATGEYKCSPVGQEYALVRVMHKRSEPHALAAELLNYEDYL